MECSVGSVPVAVLMPSFAFPLVQSFVVPPQVNESLIVYQVSQHGGLGLELYSECNVMRVPRRISKRVEP